MDKVCLIVLNYNDFQNTIRLVNFARDYDSINHIVIVDNCSTNNSFEVLTNIVSKNIELIKTEKNGGYGYGNNFGANYCINKFNPSYLLFANPDTFFENSLIHKFTNHFRMDNSIGLITSIAKLNNDNYQTPIAWKIPTSFQYTFLSSKIISKIFNINKYKSSFFKNKKSVFVECVSGSLIMIKSSVYINTGGYDENIFMYGEETLMGHKIKILGYRTLLLLDDFYIHLHDYNQNRNINEIQRKNTFKSRKYIVTNYLSKSIFSKYLCLILFWLFELEHKIIGILKRRKD